MNKVDLISQEQAITGHRATKPPVPRPPNSFVDPRYGKVWIDDDNDGPDLWDNIDPKAAEAYYADQQRRAEFAPRCTRP